MMKRITNQRSREKSRFFHNKRICTNDNCNKTFDNLKRVCDLCSAPVRKFEENQNLRSESQNYFAGISITETNDDLEVRPIIKMAEPILLNPNSYQNMKAIMKELKDKAGVGVDRHWVFVGCDGPPYCLASRLKEANPSDFAYISLVPGLGHLHMNQLKTYFKIIDKVLLEPLGKDVLNFQSTSAYSYLVNAKDTHKSWETLQYC